MAKATQKTARKGERKAAKPKSAARRARAKVKPKRSREAFVKVQLSKQVAENLGQVQSLAEFHAAAARLTPQDRDVIIDQALIMIDQTYVHLPLKRAMHAVDPVQRLRLASRRSAGYTERAFHNELISIFVRLRDLHTNYILPEPYRSRVAFLPFHVEEYFEGTGAQKKQVFVVTEVTGRLSDPNFKPGVIVTHWNGVPIATAVDINADREAGSNLDARHLQGLQTLTNRWMGMSLPPDEEWVVVSYLPATGTGPVREARFAWQVSSPQMAAGGEASAFGVVQPSTASADLARIGMDVQAEMQRRFRKLLFAPEAVSSQKKMDDLGARAPEAARALFAAMTKQDSAAISASAPQARSSADQSTTPDRAYAPELGTARRPAASKAKLKDALKPKAVADAVLDGVDLTANSILPDVIKEFGKVTSPSGTFGYIRIVTFSVGNVGTFLNEFVRILALLPQEGLIVDVRGNGGGIIAAGEGLLQTMTPKRIEPERFHLINTPLTLKMCQLNPDLAAWKESAEESVEIGAAFTQGLPLTPPEFCNGIGQTYQGPVVLIIDAGCYSTTDMFSAGFQDHEIGYVLGTSGHTGAGGANVWDHSLLENALPPRQSPFTPIPSGASFRVAIRRSTRVGVRAGEPLEDLGVVPDEVYRMTRNDVLNHNVDLIAHACKILSGMPRQRLTAAASKRPDGSFSITVVTSNIQRVDVLLNGRPVHTADVSDGPTTFDLVGGVSPGQAALECRGFRDSQLVVSTRLQA